MPHTHHSHSGQFCNHAKDSLADIISHMIDTKGMTTVALTEHIGRPSQHLYPDEPADGWTPDRLHETFENFIVEARRLRAQYALSHPHILIGFESEWIDADSSDAQQRLQRVMKAHPGTFDMWVGSIHHVHGVPIDYDEPAYQRALNKADNDEDKLFGAYFDAQFELLSRMHPPVVGHFDLVRLKSKTPDKDWKERAGVWPAIVRNLRTVLEYGGALEVNSSGLRKGLVHPYPRGEILTAWTSMGGKIVLSDDSHGVAHVGAFYSQMLRFLKDLGIQHIAVMQRQSSGEAGHDFTTVPLRTLLQHPFLVK